MKKLYSSVILISFFCQILCLGVIAKPQLSQDQKILQVLNRLTFGPKPGDIDYVKKVGINQFIEEQLNPENFTLPDNLLSNLKQNEGIMLSPHQILSKYSLPVVKKQYPNPDDIAELHKTVRTNNQAFYRYAVQAKFERVLSSPRQLQEVMTDFWFNHFNISKDKGLCHLLVANYEERAIRANALGNFRDLLGATANHAGMLLYLDNWQNSYFDRKKNNKSGINENYAREIMELHTLGVDGGYTQKDVISLAHILTGLSILQPLKTSDSLPDNALYNQASGAVFFPNRHDFSDQTVMNTKFKAGGLDQINAALDFLAYHPATAHHISYEIAQYFLCDSPPKSIVDKMAQKFLDTKGDIKEVLRTLFNSQEFFDPAYYRVKYQSPFRYVVSVLRLSDVPFDDFRNKFGVIGILNQMGEPIYSCLTPDGYKCTKEAWLNPQSILQRISFANVCGSGNFLTGHPDAIDFDNVYPVFKNIITDNTKKTIEAAPKNLKVPLLLASPENMYY